MVEGSDIGGTGPLALRGDSSVIVLAFVILLMVTCEGGMVVL